MIRYMGPRRGSVYRMFDADGTLLYIGASIAFMTRLTHHEINRPWWTEVVQVTIEHFASPDEALDAEQKAIIEEKPRYNRTTVRGAFGMIGRAKQPERGDVERILDAIEDLRSEIRADVLKVAQEASA